MKEAGKVVQVRAADLKAQAEKVNFAAVNEVVEGH